MSGIKTYILQKDTPNAKAGDRFTKTPYDSFYFNNQSGIFYSPDIVENNPEWFLPEEEPQDEIARLKAIIERLVKDDNMFSIGVQESYKESIWQKFKQKNNL